MNSLSTSINPKEHPNLFQYKQTQKKKKKAENDRNTLKRKLKKRFRILGLILLIAISVKLFYDYRIVEQGVEIKGVITSVKHHEGRMNDMDGTRINSFYIEYEFLVEGQLYTGFQEIGGFEIKKYFDQKPIVGDEVQVVYDPSNVNVNSIVKMKN